MTEKKGFKILLKVSPDLSQHLLFQRFTDLITLLEDIGEIAEVELFTLKEEIKEPEYDEEEPEYINK